MATACVVAIALTMDKAMAVAAAERWLRRWKASPDGFGSPAGR